jgi:hypothetical protein
LHLPSFNPFPERKLSFADSLLTGVPQFMLCVWELALNGWRPMDPSDAVGRWLLHLRRRRPVQIGRTRYRSAVEAVFRIAFTLAGILERYSELAAGLAITRGRHARQQTVDTWCWLRWWHMKQQAWIILHMLDGELSNLEASKIITQQKSKCERWRRAAWERWQELLPSDPGFDWSVTYSDPIDITNVSRQIVNALDGYDAASLMEELSNEVEYVSQWLLAQTSPLPGDQEDSQPGDSAAERPIRRDTASTAGAPKPRVVLRDRAEAPLVLGKEKRILTAPQYDVVKALLDAGDRGLTKDELENKSGHGDARKILKRLANKDSDWGKVIQFARITGGGYRIK